jgi:hypothetical protein
VYNGRNLVEGSEFISFPVDAKGSHEFDDTCITLLFMSVSDISSIVLIMFVTGYARKNSLCDEYKQNVLKIKYFS